jgi:hypothetical protein
LVQRIARAHGGDASIGNRANEPGALAMIFLPRLAESAAVSQRDVASSI